MVVSVLHTRKGRLHQPKRLNGREVRQITAFLFHRGNHDDPVRLSANAHQSFQGSIVLGMGFTFDDMDSKGVASPLATMRHLISKNPRNYDVIFPYLGGQEVNASPTHAHRRYVIDFAERTESECWRQWPELMEIVEQKVRPERKKKNAKKYPRMVLEWWKHWNARPELRSAIADLDRALVVSRVGHHAAFTFVPTHVVYADSLVVFPTRTYAAFCVLQSRLHDIWIRFFGSSMRDDLRYTPSDCFETFPFPEAWNVDTLLEDAGKKYYEYRAALMRRTNEGLTSMYNRFHDPQDRRADIEDLRTLHSEMDGAVLRVLGWRDAAVKCEFLPEHAAVDNEGKSRFRWRYRWTDDVRNEMLARLIELNEVRGAEEARGRRPGRAALLP